MVHVAPMGDLVGNQPAQQVWRCKDDPPIVADRAACRAASPAAPGISYRYRAYRNPGGGRLPQCLLAEPKARLVSKVALDPRSEALDWPATSQDAVGKRGLAWVRMVPVEKDVPPLEGDPAPWHQWLRSGKAAKLASHPVRLALGPLQCRSATYRPRNGQDQPLAGLVEPQSHRSRPRMGSNFDRPAERREMQRLRAAGRQGEIPGRRHLLR